jgi:hypothetical protein
MVDYFSKVKPEISGCMISQPCLQFSQIYDFLKLSQYLQN